MNNKDMLLVNDGIEALNNGIMKNLDSILGDDLVDTEEKVKLLKKVRKGINALFFLYELEGEREC